MFVTLCKADATSGGEKNHESARCVMTALAQAPAQPHPPNPQNRAPAEECSVSRSRRLTLTWALMDPSGRAPIHGACGLAPLP